jgi:DNA-binding response OmpR family regulator
MRIPGMRAPRPPVASRVIVVTSSPHVLIVEDDRAMRSMLASQLRIDGFVVHEAATSLGARMMIDRGETALDLIVVDVNLPGGSGLELATRLHNDIPQLPIILMTAYPDRTVVDFAESLHVRLLGKPFRIAEFREAAGHAARRAPS